MAKLTDKGYLNELADIRLKLDDFIEQIKSGKTSYIRDVALKLRVLYCDKSGTKALLREILNRNSLSVSVMICHSIKEMVEMGKLPESLAEGLVFNQTNSVITWFERGHEVTDPFAALERKEILISGIEYSYREVIEVTADKMAAHIDSSIPDNHLNLHEKNILIGGLPIAQRAIFDTARTSILLIDALIDRIENKTAYDFISDNKP